jgi:hypothetical protein
MAVVAGLLALTAGTFPMLGDTGVPPSARRLLFVSLAFSLFVVGTAGLYAIGASSLDLGTMARLHGTFAAIGVVFCGLLGWRLADRP